jgi:Ser/Thr protein kinase RdoA (MazF antagonist)
LIAKLAFDPPVVDLRTIEIALAEQYGLRGTYTQLHGERDLNHCLSCEDGRRFFVRVGTRSEPIIRAELWREMGDGV